MLTKKQARVIGTCTLMALAAIVSSCGPKEEGAPPSRQPTTKAEAPKTQTPKAISVTTPGPLPQISWADRAQFEQEERTVIFTGCGLYKGDTNELTGAKCTFQGGRWVLVDPKIEETDNLLSDGDFSSLFPIQQGMTFTEPGVICEGWKSWVRPGHKIKCTPLTIKHPFLENNVAMKVEFSKVGVLHTSDLNLLNSELLEKLIGKYVTVVLTRKNFDEKLHRITIRNRVDGTETPSEDFHVFEKGAEEFEKVVAVHKVNRESVISPSNPKRNGLSIILKGNGGSCIVGNFKMVRGYLPMGF